jgi:hypothetical protein
VLTTTTRRETKMSAIKRGDRVFVTGGTYKYHHAKFVKNAGAFSARIVLESTGEEKTIRRYNLRVVLPEQRSEERNTASANEVTSSTSTTKTETERTEGPKAEDLTRTSEVASAAAAATDTSTFQERARGTGLTNKEEDLAAAVLELSQLALDFSLLMARLGDVAALLSRSMSDDR